MGTITIGNDSTIGARSSRCCRGRCGKNADVAAGAGVTGKVKNGQYWIGLTGGEVRQGPPPVARPPAARSSAVGRRVRLTSSLLGAMPLLALGAGLAVLAWAVRDTAPLGDAVLSALPWVPVATLVAVFVYAAADGVRGAAAVDRDERGLSPGAQPGRLAAVDDRAPDGRRPQLTCSRSTRAC